VNTSAPVPQPEPVPPDDLRRELTVARPDDPGLLHLSVVGDTYTVLLSGDDTGGRFTLIDMYVPPGGGPLPHRPDYEETFVILDGRLDLTFRGTTQVAEAGTTINVPANAPHQFRNSSDAPARLLCISAPPGQDEFFTAIGDRVPGRTSPPPRLDQAAKAARITKAIELAPRYRSELLPPAAGPRDSDPPGQAERHK
jgi:mannose-6-phosphate isomerase-like protein (cupin superfamily)